MPEDGTRRSTFGPVVLLGLASSALAAVAGTKAWVAMSAGQATASGGAMASTLEVSAPGEMPLAAALSLVVLACWGVVLVTRARVRRGVAVLGAVSALGLLVTTVSAWFTLPDSFRDALRSTVGDVEVDSTFTWWYAAALVAAVASVFTTAAAVRFTPAWPEMGARYDAPTGEGTAPTEPEGNIDLWKALDEGRDPTEGERPLD
ncbi:Trp biosynthesis-associated membrane protein [Nocardioides currus]|uniref:Trp biosynthesis protein n=1 Tax=Nocardioides currus TaxID=2133958 RepID=A0A2R7YSB2_9ACTN|nr:Trp biosynthesis-associated membrane protein [Nocardioides currus]PUA79124.1 hypothetical protein C7S10_20495 [Nocardioides currus]